MSAMADGEIAEASGCGGRGRQSGPPADLPMRQGCLVYEYRQLIFRTNDVARIRKDRPQDHAALGQDICG